MNHFIQSISCTVVLTALAAQAAFAGDGFSNDSFPNDSAVVMNNILTRTSIRKFQQRPVEKAKVLALLKAGMAAPTARDLRPWHFVVLSDTADIHAYASTMKHHGEMIAQSPVVIYACGDTTRMMEGQARDFWVEDVSCASENILLAAHVMGLGAVWTSVYPEMRKVNGVSKALGLPANLVPLNCILVGYPDEAPEPKDKWDESNITWWKANK